MNENIFPFSSSFVLCVSLLFNHTLFSKTMANWCLTWYLSQFSLSLRLLRLNWVSDHVLISNCFLFPRSLITGSSLDSSFSHNEFKFFWFVSSVRSSKFLIYRSFLHSDLGFLLDNGGSILYLKSLLHSSIRQPWCCPGFQSFVRFWYELRFLVPIDDYCPRCQEQIGIYW